MLKKTLFATAAISATLLAAATLLPALAQSRGAASASAPSASTSLSERGQDRRKAQGSERDDRHGDERRGASSGKHGEKEERKSRD